MPPKLLRCELSQLSRPKQPILNIFSSGPNRCRVPAAKAEKPGPETPVRPANIAGPRIVRLRADQGCGIIIFTGPETLAGGCMESVPAARAPESAHRGSSGLPAISPHSDRSPARLARTLERSGRIRVSVAGFQGCRVAPRPRAGFVRSTANTNWNRSLDPMETKIGGCAHDLRQHERECRGPPASLRRGSCRGCGCPR